MQPSRPKKATEAPTVHASRNHDAREKDENRPQEPSSPSRRNVGKTSKSTRELTQNMEPIIAKRRPARNKGHVEIMSMSKASRKYEIHLKAPWTDEGHLGKQTPPASSTKKPSSSALEREATFALLGDRGKVRKTP